jgi:thymidylate synthase
MNNIDIQYQKLLQDILDNGIEKKDRTGTGTISVFGRQIRHKMSDGFPLLTTKKMAWKTMVTELLWFLRGDTNIKFLIDNNCHIWNGDAYQAYIKRYNKGEYVGKTKLLENSKKNRTLTEPFTIEEFIDKIKTDDEFAKKWGELGPVYGKQWRKWNGVTKKSINGTKLFSTGFTQIDQIQNLINDLKTNPDSRRLMVNAWNVGELDQMVLPPCHYGFQVYTSELSLERRYNIWFNNNYETGMERFFDPNNLPDFDDPYYTPTPKRAISLMWNQRSVDTFLGLPFNIASYGLLLEIIAKAVNMIPDELIGNLGDVHLYSNHIEQAKEQIGRRYTFEEREEMLKNAMGPKGYRDALNDLAPFGGGMSEYYEIYKIPNRTRQPFSLPTLKLLKTDAFWNEFDVSLFGHLDPTDFQVENYQSHPSIKAPLSN